MNENIELTLLSEEDLNSIKTLFKYDRVAGITDLGIVTGYDSDENDFNTNEKIKRPCFYYTRTTNSNKGKVLIVKYGYISHQLNIDSYDSYDNAIRPIMHIKDYNTFNYTKNNEIETENGIIEVQYGEYPQYAPEQKIQELLEKEYQSNKLKITGKKYTFNSRINPEKDNYEFNPAKYNEYIYHDKKYIRIKTISKNNKIVLSNGEKYKSNEYIWIEVSPVTWLYDEETNTLISKECLLSGIRFNDKEYYGEFKYTEMYNYMQRYMSKDIFQTTKVNEETLEESIQNVEINNLIDEINELIDLNRNENKDEINKKIDSLLEEYNKKIEKSFNSESMLLLENLDEDYLYIKLKTDLEDILNGLKYKYDKYKDQIEILDIINNCINILEHEEFIIPRTDLEQDISTIKIRLLPILNNDNKLNELKNVFSEDKEIIIDYINEKTDVKPFNNQNDYIVSIRKKLELFLISLNKEILEQKIVNEIINSYRQLAIGEKTISKNEYISYLFKEIENNIQLIKNKGTQKDIGNLNNILSNLELNEEDLYTSITSVTNLYVETYKLVLDIENKENKYKRKNDYIIKR